MTLNFPTFNRVYATQTRRLLDRWYIGIARPFVPTIEWLVLLRVAPLNPIPTPRMTRAALDPVVMCQRVDVVQYMKIASLIKPELCQPSRRNVDVRSFWARSWETIGEKIHKQRPLQKDHARLDLPSCLGVLSALASLGETKSRSIRE